MAKSVIHLEGEEIVYFHANYVYMWKKLNTAPYYVNGTGELPKWIKEPELLPSYVNLSKCMNPEFIPSMNIVNKIVQFYNANITPSISTFSFLHEKLEATDEHRQANGMQNASRYCGLYYGYYYSGNADKKEVYGAVLRISEVNNLMVAQMIAGFVSKQDMKSMRVRSLFEKTDIDPDEYKKFKESLELSKRRTTLYKGVVSAAQQSFFVQMQGVDREGSWLFFNCETLPESEAEDFYGGLGIITFINDGYELQFLKMGIVSAENKELVPFDFDNEALQGMLSLDKRANEHVYLTLDQSREWGECIIRNGHEEPKE